jgi:hypothetical protein
MPECPQEMTPDPITSTGRGAAAPIVH